MNLPKFLVLAFASLASARAVVGGTEQVEKVVAPLTLNDTCVPWAVIGGHTIGCHNFNRDWATKPKFPKTTALTPRDTARPAQVDDHLPIHVPIQNRTDNSTVIWGNVQKEMNVTLTVTNAIAGAFAKLLDPLERNETPPLDLLSQLSKGNETAAIQNRDLANATSSATQEVALKATIASALSDSLETMKKSLKGILGPLTQFGKGDETAADNSTSLEKRDMFGSGSGGHQIMYCPGWPTAVRHNLTHYKIWHLRCFCTRYHLIERQDCSYGWVNSQGPNF